MDTLSKFYTPSAIFLATVVFGFWLAYAGKPYNGILFNVHKLSALGAVIAMATQVYRLLKTSEPQVLLITLIVVAAMCVVALFTSGAFLSIGNLDHRVMKIVHNIAPVVAVTALGWILYILSGRNL